MEVLGAVISALSSTFGVPGLLIGLFHPIWLTILVGVLLWRRLRRTSLWQKHKRLILIGAVALYAIDAAIALPRILYAWRSPDHAIVHQQTELPARLVLVNAACDKTCHALLLSGAIEEVILVKTAQPEGEKAIVQPLRYRAGWSRPGACPQERQQAIGYDVGRPELLRDGFCPQIEPTDIPSEGIFVVQERLNRTARYEAVPLTSTYLVDAPPGPAIQLFAIEVQRRTRDRIEVLAERRRYAAPGVLGLPPLVGCWVRIDNMLGIYPPGDTGCGLWRWFTWGGDRNWHGDRLAWVYADVFTPAARRATPPPRPDLPPPNSSDAIEMVAQAQTSDQSAVTRYLQYFLDAPPPDIDHPSVPPGAHDIVIAKVRTLEQPAYILGRHGSASPPSKDLFFTRIEIIKVLSGRAQVGAQYDIYFGVPGLGGPRFTYPGTPPQNAREYFVVSYLSDDDRRRLVPFPVTEQEYNAWDEETLEHARLRSRPGHIDKR